MLKSVKKVKPLNEIVADRLFVLPKSMANSFDPMTGEPCIWVGINGKGFNIPIGVPTPIPYNAFCILKDNGMLSHYDRYLEGEEFQPL